jgi:hypothetical protein
VRRLCTRGKYLEIKENAYELSRGISAFLPKESKSLRKKLINLSPPTGTVKEKGRGEKKFRAFRTGNCPFFSVFFIEKDSNFTILFNSSLRMF